MKVRTPLVMLVVLVVGIVLGLLLQPTVASVLGGGSSGSSGSSGTTTTSGGAAASAGIPSTATTAVVRYVHDGDTLFLEDGRKVRLLGINTPEIGDNAECYGDEATAALEQLVPEGTPVWVQADVEPYDQYGRSLLFIYLEDGTNVNLELVATGAAEVEQYRPNLLLKSELEQAQADAKSAGLGLWSACR